MQSKLTPCLASCSITDISCFSTALTSKNCISFWQVCRVLVWTIIVKGKKRLFLTGSFLPPNRSDKQTFSLILIMDRSITTYTASISSWVSWGLYFKINSSASHAKKEESIPQVTDEMTNISYLRTDLEETDTGQPSEVVEVVEVGDQEHLPSIPVAFQQTSMPYLYLYQ